jgi:hypothetical protein
MNHENKGEIAEEDGVLPRHRRRVTFRRDLDNVNNLNVYFDRKPEAHSIANGGGRNADGSSGETLCDAERKESPGKIVGILRPRSISLSPPALPKSSKPPSTFTPRFKPSRLSDAIRRSNETRGCIEKLKKQIVHRLGQHEPREPQPNLARCGIENIENSENEPSSILARQKRRMECLESTKAMMYGQSLPPTMMSFVEEALRAAHFLRRRQQRRENGSGRIVHQILVEQHKRVLKELEHNENENRKGDTTNSHSSRQQSHKSEPP